MTEQKWKLSVLAAVGISAMGSVAAMMWSPAAQAGDRPSGAQIQVPLNGTPKFLGQIIATTTKNNADTATPFGASGTLEGKCLLLHASAAVQILPGTATTCTATTTNGVTLAAGERVTMCMALGYVCLAAVGSATVTVWEML